MLLFWRIPVVIFVLIIPFVLLDKGWTILLIAISLWEPPHDAGVFVVQQRTGRMSGPLGCAGRYYAEGWMEAMTVAHSTLVSSGENGYMVNSNSLPESDTKATFMVSFEGR